jgi:spermidine synthase
MGFLFNWRRRRREPLPGSGVELSEQDGVRYLHLGSETIQSAMRLADPFELVLSYTRSMMAFLLFQPEPRRVVNVGLGGGSVAKWIHRHVPQAQQVVLEVEPRVVAIARQYFSVPPDDERLKILVTDGALWVAGHPDCADVILVDGYTGRAQAGQLATDEFYALAARALARDGVLVVNLWGSDRMYDANLQRIERAFDGRICLLPAEQRGNVIVFAFQRPPGETRWSALQERARVLAERTGLEFPRFVDGFRKLNPHDGKRLLI